MCNGYANYPKSGDGYESGTRAVFSAFFFYKSNIPLKQKLKRKRWTPF